MLAVMMLWLMAGPALATQLVTVSDDSPISIRISSSQLTLIKLPGAVVQNGLLTVNPAFEIRANGRNVAIDPKNTMAPGDLIVMTDSQSYLFQITPAMIPAEMIVVEDAFLAAASPPVIMNPPTAQTIFLGDPATFRVVASGTAPLSYQWLRKGVVISAAVASNLSSTTAATDHNVQFYVVVTNVEGAVTSAPAVLTIDFGEPGPPQTNRWIEITNIWLYNVSQGDLGTAWTAPGYPDAAWASGGGLLYVEDSPLPASMTTALPLTAGGLPTTCYFRTRFTNNLTNAYSLNLVANLMIDDGIVCHLNGTEAFRLGMPTNQIGYHTNANRSVGNAAWGGPFDVHNPFFHPSPGIYDSEV